MYVQVDLQDANMNALFLKNTNRILHANRANCRPQEPATRLHTPTKNSCVILHAKSTASMKFLFHS